MQLTRHDGPGVIVSKKAANLLVRLVARTLELRVSASERLTADLPEVDPTTLGHLEDDGVVRIGTEVSPRMVLIGRLAPDRRSAPAAEDEEAEVVMESVDAAFGLQGGRDASLRCPPGLRGTVDSISMEEGKKKTEPRLIKVVVLTQYPLRLGDVLQAAGKREFVSALTDDEDFELRWPGLEGSHEVTRLEPFAENVLHARSIGPYSLVSDQPLATREQFGGQLISAPQLFGLLERGAAHTVHELITVKSDDALGRIKVYESIARGKPECVPNAPRKPRMLERLLLSLGFDVDFAWNRPRIKMLSTAALQEVAPGLVKKPETINYRTFRPERDGLFCEQIFGVTDSPERAVNLGRIEFAVPMMHPFARQHLARLLGVDDKRFERLLYCEELLDGKELDDDWTTSGPPALKKAAEAKDPAAARLFFEQWPVLPPALRPLVPLDGGRFATSDLNDLYRRVINRNNRTRRLIELNAPAIIIRNEVRMLQESLEALVNNGAYGRSITGPDKRPLVSLAGLLTHERGSLRAVEKRVDYAGTARFVITRDERVRLPQELAYEIFKPWLYERLERAGHVAKIKEAKREVEQRSAVAVQAMVEHAAKATLLMFCGTGATPAGVQGFELWDERVIGLGERLAARLGLRAGDTVVVHATIDPRAEKEVLALETTVAKPSTQTGGWLARASRANDPLPLLLDAALAEESDDVSDRLSRLLLARLDAES